MWTQEELNKIAATDDLHVSPFRDDGATLGRTSAAVLLPIMAVIFGVYIVMGMAVPVLPLLG